MKQRQLGADKNIEVINYFWVDLERQRWRRHFLHWFWFGKSDVVSTLNMIFFVEGLSGEIQIWSITKYKIDQFRLLQITIFFIRLSLQNYEPEVRTTSIQSES